VLEGNIVTCPWHGWRFDVTTGISPVVPTAKVEILECIVEGGEVKVKTG
jgi:nitrite reductase/ring-hydroxylating ferredoxin subunit